MSRELLRQAPTGMDKETFGQCIGNMTNLIHNTISNALPMSLDKDDVIQDALTHLYAHRSYYKGSRGCISTWASVITRRRALNTIRNAQRIMIAETTYAEARCGTSRRIDTPEENIIYHSYLRRMCKLLTPVEQTVLMLLVHPPDDLCAHIHSKGSNNVSTIDDRRLSEYLDLPIRQIRKAHDAIKRAYRLVVEQEDKD